MRRARGEAASLALALSLPAAAFCILPYSLPKASPDGAEGRQGAFAAFVTLSPEEEATAMRRAKPAARTSEAENASMRAIGLILGELPDDLPAPVLVAPPTAPAPRLPGPSARPGPFLPSLAAPPPQAIPADAAEPAPVGFSRQDLLEID